MNMRLPIVFLCFAFFPVCLFCQSKIANKPFQKNYQETSHDLTADAEDTSIEKRKGADTHNTSEQANDDNPLTDLRRKSPTHELRGVWVSTVQRVDFPSKATTNPEILKKEWMDLLAFYKSLNLNAVIVQVRPTGDAIYPSKIVPYSKWLTGKSGKPIAGNFDLLKFMIETAHSEGIEFHAWVNPYRIIIDGDTSNLDARHPFHAHRNWVMPYGREYLLNPGVPGVWKYLSLVVEEIVKKYDIDAIHFDDYFYPYKIAGEDLPDIETYNKYGKNFSNIDDWRRANTDSLIFNIKNVIKKNKPKVQLGVSPFAIWRNVSDDTEGSDTKAYQRCYDDLYSDVVHWMKNGWLDYVAPEIYFHIGHPLADYEKILNWWQEHTYGTALYISHAVYKVNHQEKYPAWSDSEEIPRQLDMARSKSEVKGLVFFSSKWLKQNELGVTDALKNYFFYVPAELPNVYFGKL